MSHAIERSILNGQQVDRAAFQSVGGWHGLGQVAEFSNLQGMRSAAAMDYNVRKEQAEHAGKMVPNQFHLVRSDDGKIISPSTVTDRYEPYQLDDMLGILQFYIDAGYAKPGTAMVLHNGSVEVMTVQLDIKRIDGDASDWSVYFGLRNHHGGTGSVEGIVTGVRIVCANTASAAFAKGADFRIRHSRNVADRVRVAAGAWNEAKEAIARFEAHAAQLAATKIHNIPATIDALLGITNIEDAATRTLTKRNELIAYANRPDMGTFGQSAWDIFNAVTAYNTHNAEGKGAQDDSQRIASILGGARGNFELATFDKLLALT